MEGYFYIIIGIMLAIIGGITWWRQEKHKKLVSFAISISILLIILGAFNILLGIEYYIGLLEKSAMRPAVDSIRIFEWVFILGLIFLGSISYTIAAYYHLKLENWSFLTAFAIALPLILIEYQFSIRGNHAAKHILKLNAVQITLLTMTFYFINAWVLNYFFLKQPIVWWREILAFMCIILAFLLTTRST